MLQELHWHWSVLHALVPVVLLAVTTVAVGLQLLQISKLTPAVADPVIKRCSTHFGSTSMNI